MIPYFRTNRVSISRSLIWGRDTLLQLCDGWGRGKVGCRENNSKMPKNKTIVSSKQLRGNPFPTDVNCCLSHNIKMPAVGTKISKHIHEGNTQLPASTSPTLFLRFDRVLLLIRLPTLPACSLFFYCVVPTPILNKLTHSPDQLHSL